MQIKVKKHSSRVIEAIDLASLVAENESYEKRKQYILEKYHFETFDVEKMMNERAKIARSFQRDFQSKQDQLQFFFSWRSKAFSLARLFTKMPYFQFEKRRCRAVFNEDENRVQAFVDTFRELSLIDESAGRQISDFEQLSLLLETMDIEDEDKWLLQTIYLHLDGYLKRFCTLVNQIVEWLMDYEEMICEEEIAFYDYWVDFSSKNDFADYISKKLNFDVTSKVNQIWIVPAYFACHRIYYEYRQESILYVYIGMIFDQSFSFEKKYETPALLCSHLRLVSDPSKFEILKTIKERAYYGSELAKLFHLSTPTISHHMQSLENAGFIKTEKRENKTFYSLDHERLTLFFAQIHHMLLEKEEIK